MKKYIVIALLLLLLGGICIYYFLQQSKSSKPDNVELWLPSDVDYVVKLDLSQHYLEIAKELLSLPEDDIEVNRSLPLFIKELKENKGAGINYLSPLYTYQTKTGRGVVLGMAHKETFDTFVASSKGLVAINDSVFQVPENKWKLYWDHSVLIVFDNELPRKQDSCAYSFGEKTHLLSSVINYNGFNGVRLNVSISELGLKLETVAATGKGLSKGVYMLPKDKAVQADLFIEDIGDTSMFQSVFGKQSVVAGLLNSFNNPLHMQYLGKGEKEVKSISYDYNDDFEMEEVVVVSKVPTQNIRLLVNTASKQEGVEIKKILDDKISYFAPYSELNESYVLYSNEKIVPFYVAAHDYLTFSIKKTEDILSIANQFQVDCKKLAVDSISVSSTIDDGNMNTLVNVYLPEERRGLIPMVKMVTELIDNQLLK